MSEHAWTRLRRWDARADTSAGALAMRVVADTIDQAEELAATACRGRGLEPSTVGLAIALDGSNLGVPWALLPYYDRLVATFLDEDEMPSLFAEAERHRATWAAAKAILALVAAVDAGELTIAEVDRFAASAHVEGID